MGNALNIVTWNVNSVRQRLPHLLAFLKEVSPDVLGLQEIKCLDEAFPRAEIEDLGYNVATHGQKTFNGVALITKAPCEVVRGLPGESTDEHARYIEGVIALKRGGDAMGHDGRLRIGSADVTLSDEDSVGVERGGTIKKFDDPH